MSHEPVKLREVHRVAQLAHLHLTPEQEAQTAADFENILRHVDKLEQADTQDVPPTQHAVALTLHLRDDAIAPSLGTDEALSNAPERLGDGFGVPKIIE